jgi:CBS domain-containing protein
MDTIAHILKDKGTNVHHASPDVTVLSAVELMAARQIGALMVCQEGHPLGMFTERDLMTRVILAGRDPGTTRLEEVMSKDVIFIEPSTPAEEAMAVMTERRCRHLPVVSEGRVVGLISIGDLVRWASRNQEFHIRQLEDYICGKYPG